MALDLCIFLSWFRQDGFFNKASHIRGLNLAVSNVLKLNSLMMDLYYKHAAFYFTRCNLLDCICVDYCGLLWCFISCSDSNSDGTHSTAEEPLVSEWCKATFLEICSDEDKLIYILDVTRVLIFSKCSFLSRPVSVPLRAIPHHSCI